VINKNKQEWMIQKTAYHNIDTGTIVKLLLTHRSSKQVRDRYKLNTHHITVLFGCYLYVTTVKDKFTLTGIRRFVSYYSHYRLIGYIDRLVSIDLLNLSGRYYSITDKGYQAIEEISNTNDKVIYEFCSKYNIIL
jgi:hypothetical protein